MNVVIREARPDDAEGMITYMQIISSEPNNYILWESGEFSVTVENERKMLESAAASDNSIFVVADAGGQIVGIANCAGGTRRATRHSALIGISLHPDYRDQGIGTRMMRYIISWARETGIIRRLDLHVFTYNARAIHLYEKLGFVLEGIRRKAYLKDGKYVDSMAMALLLDET
ncbi:MAG TPA: GNAT family protein [Chloroflexia bacterium]|nr:GNAT family protein [Chloroflexia bacterium]